MDTVTLDFFDGKRFLLMGADTDTMQVENYSGSPEEASCLRLMLDGIVYTAIEDPSDGYRSSLSEILVGGKGMANLFEATPVIAKYIEKDGERVCRIVTFTVEGTDIEVAAIGTTNTDDYYPRFVGSFDPEALTRALRERRKSASSDKIRVKLKKLEAEPQQVDPNLTDPEWGTW